MNTMYKKKMFLSSMVLSLLTLISMFFVGVSSVSAANPQFNYMSNDLKTVRLGNYTASNGTLSWSGTISAVAGDRIVIDVYYHNGVIGTTANNTKIKINFPTTSSTQMVFSGALWANNATQVNDTATLNITSAQTITFENQARWLPNQVLTSNTMIPVTNNGNSVEVNIGDIAGGWPSQGHVMFYLNISKNTESNNPVVNAGPDVSVNEGQTVNLSATASDPQGNPMTYTWNCTGGSLSNSVILNPTYTAPSVNANTTYVCTFTARDNGGNTGSDTVNITVLNNGGSNNPVVNAGPDVSVNEGQTVNLLATASDPQGNPMTYTWSCTAGSLSNSVILNPTYTAPSVNANTTYVCTFTARDNGGNTGSDTVNITVIDSNSNSPVVNAGPDVSVNEGQTVNLLATASDPQGNPMTYTWSCTGGSLSNSVILNPIYTAPSVSANTTYVCTFTARDNGGNTGSDTVNITVLNAGAPNDPIVEAGSSITIAEGQSTFFSATATDPQGNPMTYTWSCTGGTLSNSVILNPMYTAPAVSSDTTYVCTFTARDNGGNTGSDSLIVNVTDNGGGGGGPSVSVSLSASPSTGTSPLNGVDLIATAHAWGISDDRLITYKFDCDGDNSFEAVVQTLNRTYVATDLCNYYYDGSYTAKVKIEVDGYDSWNQVNIRVGVIPGNDTDGISVEAGSSKDIGENQSTILNGYGYSQYGYALTYNWTCNGGSLSNSNSLTPTYYAPSVNVDTTYACTLYVTDGRGHRNSDSVSIVVRNNGGYSTGLSVTTNSATNVFSTAATLNGTLINNGGQSTSVRFNWGKLSSYNNFTPWISNKNSGQTFDYYVSGLEKGKAYHYRTEASNGREVVVGQDVSFVTKPDAVTGFSAVAIQGSQISLRWNKAVNSCYTMVVRKVGSYSLNSSDGTVVYYGVGSSVIDKNLINNVWYYYRAWSVGCDEGLVSYSESQNARAYTTTGSIYIPPVVEKVEAGISVDTLARDVTQNEIAWQNSITASPSDEIEFKVIITPTGSKSLEDVVLKAILSNKINSIRDIRINDEAYAGSLSDDMKLGTIVLGESKIIDFKGKIDAKENFSYGSNELITAIEISAENNTTVKKNITIDVTRGVESGAGLLSLIDFRAYIGLLLFLLLILIMIIIYLLIERKKGKECLVEKADETRVEKSKYFNIK